MKTTNPSDLPQVAAEYIDSVVKNMRYRKKVRAEVRQELTDHFTDALADCETEKQKQTVTKELIEEFGDVELLGKLLRRAKKRCRPLWRTMVARTFQLLGLCVVLLILYIGWFFTGKPQITTNYVEVMNQQVRPVADESQNAWPYYKQAAEKYVKYETEDADIRDERIDISPRNPSVLSEQDRHILLQWVNNNKESIDLIKEGNRKPYYWRQYGRLDEKVPDELIAIHLPHLGEFKKLAQTICWKGLFNAAQGDFEKTFNDLLGVYSFGSHIRGHNTTLIEQLVGMSIEGLARETTVMILAEYGDQIDAQVLSSVRKQFQAMIVNEDFTVDYGSQKLFMRDEAQRCFTQSRFGKSHLYLPRFRELGMLKIDTLNISDKDDVAMLIKAGLMVLFTHPDKEQTLKEVEQIYGKMEKRVAMTPASVKAQGLNSEILSEEFAKKNTFIAILMPALSKVNQIAWRVRTQVEGALVILAIVQYGKEHGQYPDSLDELIEEGLLKEVPMDPYSDKPLVYKKTEDGFMLYSVGLNFVDDGGIPGTDKNGKPRQWGENGDGILWPVDVQ